MKSMGLLILMGFAAIFFLPKQMAQWMPKNHLSRWVGKVAKLPLGNWVIQAFAAYYRIHVSEAEKPIGEYKTLNEFFTRQLKPGLRPLGGALVLHPADSLITASGKIENGILLQAKGISYKIPDLVGRTGPKPTSVGLSEPGSLNEPDEFEGGIFATYYLCPTDYHRVHSPVDGVIEDIIHVPGELWPVNAWSVANIENLFGVNERVIININTPYGPVALVMVAATNVGDITIPLVPELQTNQGGSSKLPEKKSYPAHQQIKKGDELGIFQLGSTVVMLYSKSFVNSTRLSPFELGPVKVNTSAISTSH